jgi:hypothetical protein
LVVLALVGLAAIGVLSLTGNLSNSSKRAEGVVGKTLFKSSLRTYLHSPLGCEDLKVSNGGGGFFTNTPTDITLTKWNYQGYPSIHGGTNLTHFDLELLTAQFEPLNNSAKVTSLLENGSKQDLNKSTIVVRARVTVGKRTYNHIYNVPVLATPAGEIAFCDDEMTVAEACASAKGIYNPVTRACDLSEGCLIRDTYSIITCNYATCDTRLGVAKMNKYTGGQSCPANSTAVQTHGTTWASTASCGKKCTIPINNEMQWFSCMACP